MVTFEDLTALTVADDPGLVSEQDYYAHWQQVMDPSWSAEQMAFTGGTFASQLSYLFIAGYQSAMARTFGRTDNLWQALAISEDRSSTSPKPGVKLDRQQKINGFKTWVAASDCLSHILFNAASENGDRLYRAAMDTPGLSVHSKPPQKFLSQMSQGIAEFCDVDATSLPLLLTAESTDEQQQWLANMKRFGKREPLYLYFALCGRIHHKTEVNVEPLIRDLLQIAVGDFTANTHKAAFADVDTKISELFPAIQAQCFPGATDSDQGLIKLYSAVIQKRAGRG